MASFSAISLDTTEHSDAIRVGWALGNRVAAWRVFRDVKRVAHRGLSSRHDMWQSGYTHLPGPRMLPLGGHLKAMRLEMLLANWHRSIFNVTD
jgi:hypothetical protein